MAKSRPQEWHCSLKTIEDTCIATGMPIITRQMYEDEIAQGMPEAVARQEFYCDWEAAIVGSIYGDLIEKAKADGRVGLFPHDPGKLVYTAWDIGLDCNSIVFAQESKGGDPRIID